MITKKPVLLIVLDGMGVNNDSFGNPLAAVDMGFYNGLLEHYPHTLIEASGEYVGLPDGQMGNSEVGHLNLGSGRKVVQSLVRINNEISDGSFFKNPVLVDVLSKIAKSKSTLHLAGVLSNGGVHSSIEHLFALIKAAKQYGVERLVVHAFTDGRDTAVELGKGFVRLTIDFMKEVGLGQLMTVCGRVYGMDREERFNRTEKAFNLIVRGEGTKTDDIESAIQTSYKTEVFDEFIQPISRADYAGMQDGDTIFFFNFRADRMRQITSAFADIEFSQFERQKPVVTVAALMEYDKRRNDIINIYRDDVPQKTLGEIVSAKGGRQYRLSETTKFAHITYFFNGGINGAFKGEDRKLIESVDVESFAGVPKMRAVEITDDLVAKLKEKVYDFILVNYSNCDMIGHTGNMESCKETLKCIDTAISKFVPVAIKNGYTTIITADHGNIERMLYESGEVCTTHTISQVNLILVDDKLKLKTKVGALCDVAPTVLEIMDIDVPEEMQGESLLAQ